MPDLAVSIGEDDVMRIFGDLVESYVSCEVMQAQINRVPMPRSKEFVVITQKSMVQTSTPIDTFEAFSQSVKSPLQFTVQVDFYGSKGIDRASSIAAILRDSIGTDFFKASGYDMQTLYAGDARQMPLVTGEEQYLARWTMDAVFQINQIITLPTETANSLTVNLINVDATFPP